MDKALPVVGFTVVGVVDTLDDGDVVLTVMKNTYIY